jgi:hypothetical protein
MPHSDSWKGSLPSGIARWCGLPPPSSGNYGLIRAIRLYSPRWECPPIARGKRCALRRARGFCPLFHCTPLPSLCSLPVLGIRLSGTGGSNVLMMVTKDPNRFRLPRPQYSKGDISFMPPPTICCGVQASSTSISVRRRWSSPNESDISTTTPRKDSASGPPAGAPHSRSDAWPAGVRPRHSSGNSDALPAWWSIGIPTR